MAAATAGLGLAALAPAAVAGLIDFNSPLVQDVHVMDNSSNNFEILNKLVQNCSQNSSSFDSDHDGYAYGNGSTASAGGGPRNCSMLNVLNDLGNLLSGNNTGLGLNLTNGLMTTLTNGSLALL